MQGASLVYAPLLHLGTQDSVVSTVDCCCRQHALST